MKILSLFDGISCARVGLEKAGINIESYFASEIDKYAISIVKKNWPDTIQIGDVQKVKYENGCLVSTDTKYNGFYKTKIDLVIGGSPCFVAGTLITTKRGQIPIEEVIIGDEVFTHLGNWKKVLKIGSTYTTTRIIKAEFDSREHIVETTDDHPFWGYKNKYFKKEPEWIKAKDLNVVNSCVSTWGDAKKNFNVISIVHITNLLKASELYRKYTDVLENKKLNKVKQVYNLEVEDDNSYLANWFIVHNCQDLSIAKNNREGLAGKRSSLFFDFVRLVKEIKPKYFILENVNSMPKEAKKAMSEALWNVEPVMINASLVSAQNRKRLFFVGKLVNDVYVTAPIIQPEDRGILLKDILELDVDRKYFLSDAVLEKLRLHNKDLGDIVNKCKRVGDLGSSGQGQRVYSIDGKSSSLTSNGGGQGAKTGLYYIGDIVHKDRVGDGKTLSRNVSEGYRVYLDMGKSATLTAETKGGYGGFTGMYLLTNIHPSGHGQSGNVYATEGKAPTLMAGGTKGYGNGYIFDCTEKVEAKGVALRTWPRTKTKGISRRKQLEARSDEKANSLTTIQTDSLVCVTEDKKDFVVNIYDYYNKRIKTVNAKGKTHQQDLIQSADGKSRTIPAGTHGSTPHLLKTFIPSLGIIRKLTPVECERLQSVPDCFTSIGINENDNEVAISDTQRYKALGNAFNCEVIAHILTCLKEKPKIFSEQILPFTDE